MKGWWPKLGPRNPHKDGWEDQFTDCPPIFPYIMIHMSIYIYIIHTRTHIYILNPTNTHTQITKENSKNSLIWNALYDCLLKLRDNKKN